MASTKIHCPYKCHWEVSRKGRCWVVFHLTDDHEKSNVSAQIFPGFACLPHLHFMEQEAQNNVQVATAPHSFPYFSVLSRWRRWVRGKEGGGGSYLHA